MKSIKPIALFVSLFFFTNSYCQQVHFDARRATESLREYMTQYPESQLRDIYKFCFQDFFGLEHILTDSASAVAYIEKEIAIADEGEWQPEPFAYPLLMGNFTRVDLAYVHNGKIKASELVSAMLKSQCEPMDIEQWRELWHTILKCLDEVEPRPLNYEEDINIIEELFDSGEYALHHSEHFNETYHQHYRIVRTDVFKQLFDK